MTSKVESEHNTPPKPGYPIYCSSGGPPPHHLTKCHHVSSFALERDTKESFLTPGKISNSHMHKARKEWIFGKVLDPRSKSIQKWNRFFLLSRFMSLAIDPLFLFAMIMKQEVACLAVDGVFAMFPTILRCIIDVSSLWHMWLQLKLAYVAKKSLVVGRGKLVWDARKIALHYLYPTGGFILDVLVIFPILQIAIWKIIPTNIKQSETVHAIMNLMVIFLFEFTYKVIHLLMLVQRMQHVTGYIFGTAWWGFVLNLTAYLIAAHVAGSCWYLLAIHRIVSCFYTSCKKSDTCTIRSLGCDEPITFYTNDKYGYLSSEYLNITSHCLVADHDRYGIFQTTVPLVTTRNWLNRVLYSIFWGIMTLSSFGNALIPSNNLIEVAFAILVITCGLLLFTLLIGNIQVFLQSILAKKEVMRNKIRDLEWWMKRRQLPSTLRQRVRKYERQKWASTRGVDEILIVHDLPEGIRRDIKRHLCLDLIRQVPLFVQMDEIVLDSICDRVKPLLLVKGETVIRNGDPVLQMVFIVRGYLQSIHQLSGNKFSVFTLVPGNFCGDELLSWCLRKPFVDRLPPSIATLTCLTSVEAFGLEAQDLKYVTEHFRYKVANENLKRIARYYSPGWRTWAAVTIQLAWRRFKSQIYSRSLIVSPSTDLSKTDRNLTVCSSRSDRIRMYTAILLSPKPQDQLE